MGAEWKKSKQLRMNNTHINKKFATINHLTIIKQQQNNKTQNQQPTTNEEETADELIPLQAGESLRHHHQESRQTNHLSSEISKLLLTLKFRDSEIASLLQENIKLINSSEINLKKMATTMERNMDNDFSSFSNGATSTSRPISRSRKQIYRNANIYDMELDQDTRNQHTPSNTATNPDNGTNPINPSNGVIGSSRPDEVTATTQNTDTDTIMQWNMNGFWNKYENLKILMEKWTPKIICLQETRLKPKKNPKIKGYNGYYDSKDANHAQHGTCILVKNDVKSEDVLVMTELNAVAARISLEVEITVCSLYISPSDVTTVAKSRETAAKVKGIIDQLPRPFLILGDFNAHSQRWGGTRDSVFGKDLIEIIDTTDTIILNTGEKTHFSLASGTESVLDLALSTADLAPKFNWFVHEDLHGSDHYPIIIQSTKPTIRSTKRPRWILSTAKWPKYKNEVRSELQRNASCIQSITSTIINCAKKCIKRTKETIADKPLKWMNEDLRKLIRERRQAERKLKRPHTTADLINYKRLKAKVRYELKNARKKAWEEFTSTITNQTPATQIWSKISKINGKPRLCGITRIRNDDGTTTDNPAEIARKMASHFAENSSNNQYSSAFLEKKLESENEELNIDDNHVADYNNIFSENEMLEALDGCSGSSPGPDDVEYELIKQLYHSEKLIILNVFNQIWTSGEFPEEWKIATVIPVAKPGKDPEMVGNYRPIALTSCLCKLLERMVNKRLVYYLENNNLLANQQYGFRKNRSTLDVLSILENEACEAIRRKHYFSLCSLDLTSAYDRCWRRGILNEMLKMNINGRMLRYSSNFMSNRRIKVAIGNTMSNEVILENGVPQGAVISVTLFLIAINPITKLETITTKMVGYADDWVVYSSSALPHPAYTNIQTVIDKIDKWTSENGFSISNNKTKTLMISRRAKVADEPKIRIQGQEIENVLHHKILGLTFDYRLN
jgi:endonuclease/exonuclease/phosphatase family metal-dependent hydrolase